MRDSRVYQPERSDLLNSFATPVREPAVARGLRGLVEPVAVAADSGKEGSGDFRCNQGFRDFFAVRWRGAFVVSTLLLALIVGASPPIALPDAATSVARVEAGGVQIYRCSSSPPATPAWTLDHPAATLYAEDGTIFGMHGAGPSWTASDGSSIAADGAHPIARIVPSGTPAVPWLALTVVRHTGTGTLAAVRYVERYDTLGGLAPDPATCTPQSVGTFRAVHYSAVYEFFQ
jgi:hypothetical protein